MNKLLIGFLMLSLSEARGYSGGNYRGDKTHNLGGYVRKNGTYVAPHVCGNTSSGIHCYNNACY